MKQQALHPKGHIWKIPEGSDPSCIAWKHLTQSVHFVESMNGMKFKLGFEMGKVEK